MLTGIDISRYQKNLDKQYIIKQDFIMIKATEGTTYKDFMMDGYTGLVDKHEILKGYYHKARPDKNLPIPEAKKFISKVKNYLGDALLALEWNCDIKCTTPLWVVDWMSYIKDTTGITPIIQIHGKEIERYGILAKLGFPLWIIDWNSKEPDKIGEWKNWTMWQNAIDLNMIVNKNQFNGSKEDFIKLCKGVK